MSAISSNKNAGGTKPTEGHQTSYLVCTAGYGRRREVSFALCCLLLSGIRFKSAILKKRLDCLVRALLLSGIASSKSRLPSQSSSGPAGGTSEILIGTDPFI